MFFSHTKYLLKRWSWNYSTKNWKKEENKGNTCQVYDISFMLGTVPILSKLSQVLDLIEIDEIQYCNIEFELYNWDKLLKITKKTPIYYRIFENHPLWWILQNLLKTLSKSSIWRELTFVKCKNYGNLKEQNLANSNLGILSISQIWQ